jgi:hypothetical protein
MRHSLSLWAGMFLERLVGTERPRPYTEKPARSRSITQLGWSGEAKEVFGEWKPKPYTEIVS